MRMLGSDYAQRPVLLCRVCNAIQMGRECAVQAPSLMERAGLKTPAHSIGRREEGKMVDPRIRVMIVDDHEMVRNGLTILIEAFDDLDLVGTATNGQEAIELCDRIEADVVLMDLVMPKMDGIAAIRILRQSHPQIQFVALKSFGDQELLEAVMEAGAASHVLKSAPIDQVARAIRAAARASAPRLAAVGQDTFSSSASHKTGGVQSNERSKVPQVRTDMDRRRFSTPSLEISWRRI